MLQYLVSWVAWSHEYNDWVDAADVTVTAQESFNKPGETPAEGALLHDLEEAQRVREESWTFHPETEIHVRVTRKICRIFIGRL